MKYGLPYKGSKNKIAGRIFDLFPRKKHFYDLFCGGCAMTHYALLHGNFETYHINDINWMCPTLFLDAIHGKYKNENRWISREDFEKLKNTDPYVAFVWSFGNDLRSYLYAEDLEPLKKAWHYAVVFRDYSLMQKYGIDLSPIDYTQNIYKRYLTSKRILCACCTTGDQMQNLINKDSLGRLQSLESLESLQSLEKLQSLQSLERLQSLESLERLERLERLEGTSLSYDQVEILPNSVIYCDIPYENTNCYGKNRNKQDFDFEKFYLWCEKQTEPVFISSYEMPLDRFVIIDAMEHRSTLSSNVNNAVTERVFIPRHQAGDYSLPGSLFNFDEMGF